ncbi:UNVERIFIED_CONTAM: hypothetical protein FKN15_078060 [Acipenser sinensis]
MMPEIRDLSEALPELPMDPITGVGVVVSRNRAPTGYEVTVSFCSSSSSSSLEEPAFRKRRLCIKFIPRDSTEAAICDIRILGRSKQAPPQYTFIGELNSMAIWYRMGMVPRTQEPLEIQTPTSSQIPTSAPNLPRHISMTLPASFRGKNNTRPDYEHQSSNLYAISGKCLLRMRKLKCQELN